MRWNNRMINGGDAIDTILFDWDGTLVDTASAAFDATQNAFLDLGLFLEFETYERIYSPNWRLMYEALNLPHEKWQAADDRWLHHYALKETPQMVSGGRQSLDAFMRGNYELGIVTSGNRVRVTKEIRAFGLEDHFSVVICSDDVENRKPHPEGLELAMRLLGKSHKSCCYVGDCPDDIIMGKQAGVLTIGIPGEYPASKSLLDAFPDLWFESLPQFCHSFALVKTLEV